MLIAIAGLMLNGRMATTFAAERSVLGHIDEFVATGGPAQPPSSTSPLSARAVSGYAVDNPSAYVYRVRPGESWIAIARRFGVNYADLRASNPGLWSQRGEMIRPGDEMAIPGLTSAQMIPSIQYVVQPGDSWYKIADRFGVSYWDLRLDNGGLWARRGIYIRPGDEVVVKNASQPASTAAQPVAPNAATAQTQPDEPGAVNVPESAVAPIPNAGTVLPETNAGSPILVTTVPDGATVYTVRPGDTWFSIATGYGIEFSDLRVANPTLWTARGQAIRPGDQMIIPPHGTPPPPPDVRSVPEEDGGSSQDEEGETPLDEIDEDAEPGEVAPETPADEAPADEAARDDSAQGAIPAPVAPPDQTAPPEATRFRIQIPEPALTYVIGEGEDWAAVAARAGVSVAALQAANPALRGQELAPGDVLRAP